MSGPRRSRAPRLPLALAALGLGTALLSLRDPPFTRADGALRADAALVLSGDVDYLRVRCAAQLWRQGAFRELVVTGAGVGGDSALALKAEALSAGVAEQAILLETASRSTHENLLFAAPLVRRQGWRRVALVTSASHMGRAQRVARRVLPGVEWIGVPVADAGPASRVLWQRLQEWLKLVGYLLHGWA